MTSGIASLHANEHRLREARKKHETLGINWSCEVKTKQESPLKQLDFWSLFINEKVTDKDIYIDYGNYNLNSIPCANGKSLL